MLLGFFNFCLYFTFGLGGRLLRQGKSLLDTVVGESYFCASLFSYSLTEEIGCKRSESVGMVVSLVSLRDGIFGGKKG